MSTRELVDCLDRILPDSRVFDDVRSAIDKEIKSGGFSPEDVEKLSALNDVGDVVNKRFVVMRYDIGFGTHYVCRVAVGGVLSHKLGIVTPRLFIAELYYSHDVQLITVDFSADAPDD